jgi:GT2 family glycosyltransferase
VGFLFIIIGNRNLAESIKISVCICTFNEHHYLYDCLQSLVNQNVNINNYEIVVLDNSNNLNNNDYEKCIKLSKKYWNIKYIVKKTNGLSDARNQCIKISNYDHLHFIDDDVTVENNFVESILNVISRNPNIHIFGGKVIPNWKNCDRPCWLSDVGLSYLSMLDFGDKEIKFGEIDGMYLVGANIMFSRKILNTYEGFNCNLGRNGNNASLLGAEENDLVFRAIKNNQLVKYAPSVMVRHIIRKERLNESWFIKRAAWQSVTDVITNTLYMKESGSWSNYKNGFTFLKESVNKLFRKSNNHYEFDEKIKTAKLLAFYMLNEFEE